MGIPIASLVISREQAQVMTTRRSAQVGLGLTLSVAAVLSGCASPLVGSSRSEQNVQSADGWEDGSQEPEYVGVCVDEKTQNRLPDSECGECVDNDNDGMCDGREHRHSAGGAWMFFAMGMMVPAIGSRVSGATHQRPAGSRYVAGGVPRAGGPVDRAMTSTIRKPGSGAVSRGGFGGSSNRGGSWGG